jgi:nucleoside-diphosphate-sugar epimerase
VRVFVAGATGVIGRQLVPTLVAVGHAVGAVARTDGAAAWLRSVGAEPVVVDVYDRDVLIAAVRAARPDAVVHQLTDLSTRSSAANAALRVTGTRNLVDAAHAAGVRRIVAQSISWVYAPGDRPALESDPLDVDADEPRRTTVEGVRSLEDAVAEVAEPVVLRYGTLYGPGTWYSVDGSVADQLRAGALTADASVSSFVHVVDAAAAAIDALEWPPATINLCDDEPAPATAWMPELARRLGAPAPVVATGRPGWARGADNGFAREHRSWKPRVSSWREGFRDAL